MDPASVLSALTARPFDTAILLDVDGTLAPIAERPEDAVVPGATRRELARLTGAYGLVACISGRPSADAARVVGVEGIRYVGEHGLELEPEAEGWAAALAAFARTVDWPAEPGKRLSLSFHYRTAGDRDAARRYLDEVAARATAAGLDPRFGRLVLEIRPSLPADKGTAVRRLLDDAGLRRALFAGDDTTDLDAFRALEGLELGVSVAVASSEAPDVLAGVADIVLDSPEALGRFLAAL